MWWPRSFPARAESVQTLAVDSLGDVDQEGQPGSLACLEFDLSYESSAGDLVGNFYLPALARSRAYDRAAGYFSSSIFALVGLGMSDFCLRGGRVRLVCSPHLSSEDIEAIERGTELREEVDAAVERDLKRLLADPRNLPAVELLATLVALEALELRIAYPYFGQGLFHDKLGIFGDGAGNHVSFRGSSNETFPAWEANANHESFEVFCSWAGGADAERVDRHRRYFQRLWDGHLDKLVVLEIGEATRALLQSCANPEGLEAALNSVRRTVASDVPGTSIVPQQHQALAIDNWHAAGCRGIVDHVTGAGKTITALTIARRWLDERGPVLIFVPTLLLARQWLREIQRVLPDPEIAVLRVDGETEGWQRDLRTFSASGKQLGKRVVVATMASGAKDRFLRRIDAGDHLLVIADEVHHLGSPVQRQILQIDAGGRLGLSATPERFGDPVGSTAIFEYFGQILPPPFTIADGIRVGRLVPYDYHIALVEMTEDEWEQWEVLSDRIAQVVARSASVPQDSESGIAAGARLRQLFMERARIKKQAANKPVLAAEIVARNYSEGHRWLVYCDDQAQLRSVIAALESQGIRPDEYHSAMQGARAETLDHFDQQGGVLVAIRCLDEGVDIPSVTHALILASSANRREFIQRRGRVLRTANGTKHSATIHDVLVTAPGHATRESVLPSELERAAEFAATARNAAVRMQIARMRSLADTQQDDYEPEDQDDSARAIEVTS